MGDMTLFDYADMPAETVMEIRVTAERIRDRMRRSVDDAIAIGLDLVSVKGKLPHGAFLPWIEAEFGMSDKTAQKMMNVAQVYGGKSELSSNLPLSVYYELAAPSTPEPVRQIVEQKVDAGESISVEEVKRLKRELADKDVATTRAAREAEKAKREAEAEKARAADLLGQVNMLKENAEAVRIKAEQDAEAKVKTERDRLLEQVEQLKNDAERVRREAEAAAQAQAEAAAQAELAKVDAEVKAARRKEAEAKASVERLREVEAEKRRQIAEHQEYLSRVQNSDAEARDLIEQMKAFDAAVSEFALVLASLEHEHSGKAASTALSIADRCEKMAQMLMGIGRPRIVYDAEVVNG